MEGGADAFRDLLLGIMSTFVNVKIVRFAVIVNKERKTEKNAYGAVCHQMSWG